MCCRSPGRRRHSCCSFLGRPPPSRTPLVHQGSPPQHRSCSRCPPTRAHIHGTAPYRCQRTEEEVTLGSLRTSGDGAPTAVTARSEEREGKEEREGRRMEETPWDPPRERRERRGDNGINRSIQNSRSTVKSTLRP
jgi:hypothetical protein